MPLLHCCIVDPATSRIYGWTHSSLDDIANRQLAYDLGKTTVIYAVLHPGLRPSHPITKIRLRLCLLVEPLE